MVLCMYRGYRITFLRQQKQKTCCQILNADEKVVAVATRVGSLYYLECKQRSRNQQLSVVEKESKERIWHRRFGHLGEQNVNRLARKQLVDSFDYETSQEIGFCETCIEGKHHRSQFKTSEGTRSKEPLGLVHSDVCDEKSMGGAEYFLTFIDDKTRYVWIYPLKHKDEVFERFLLLKRQVVES